MGPPTTTGYSRGRRAVLKYGRYCDDCFIGVVCDVRFHRKLTKPGLAMAPDLKFAPA